MTPAVLVFVALLLVAVVAVTLFNRLVTLQNRVRNAYAQIDVQLKRRYDLIPNLVETVRGYMQHERATLEAVLAARGAALNAANAAAAAPGDAAAVRSLLGAESALAGLLMRLRMIVEAYPDLKADRSAGQLMEELTSTENRVAFARQAYNDAVAAYNTACGRFPNNLVALAAGFSPAEMFEVTTSAEAAAPAVSF